MKRILFVLLILCRAAAADDTIGVHVVKGGETLQSITAHYLGNSSAWQENWKLNRDLTDPNRLVPGQRIRVIVARTLPAQQALIRRVSRRVEKKPEPEPWTTARAGDRLAERGGVHTFAASSAELQFEDDTRLTLTEQSLVFLRSSRPATPSRDRSSIEIIDGHADLEKPAKTKRAHDIEVIVGTTVATAADPAARARFRNAGKKAQVMSYQGSTAVESAGARVSVKAGMGVSVPEGEKPPEPEKLLPAPDVSAVDVSVPRPLLQWPVMNGAKSYAVEICRDRGCAEIVARDADVAANAWRPADALPAGSLFWRVTARSASGLDGYPGAAPLRVRLGISGVIRTDDSAGEGARVSLYRGETLVASTRASSDGAFVFSNVEAGDYAVTVDSRSLHATAWAEEVAPSPGGRRPGVPDDARTLATSEHVARTSVSEGPVDGIEFHFSFGAVSHAGDDGQGSLRQAVLNANALPGPNEIRRVVGSDARVAGSEAIRLASPLPVLMEAVTIAGRPRREEIGSVTRVGAAGEKLRNPSLSDLSIDFGGAAVGFDAAGDLTLRDIVLTGAETHVRAAKRLVAENVVVGRLLDRREAIGFTIAGNASLQRMLVTGMRRGGIIVERGGRIDAQDVEVSDCGSAVTIASPGSRIRRSLFLLNATGASLAAGNTIEQSTFRGNRIAATVDGGTFEPGDNEFDGNIQ
jgi:hypothetical protein